MKRQEIFFTFGKIFMDAGMVFGALLLAFFLRMNHYEFFGLESPTPFPENEFIISALNITFFSILIFILQKGYNINKDEKLLNELIQVFWNFTASLALVVVSFFFLQKLFFSRFILGMFWVLGLFTISFGRILLRKIQNICYLQEKYKQTVLILGTGEQAVQVIQKLKNKKKYKIIGILTETKSKQKNWNNIPVLGCFKNYEEIIKKNNPTEIYLITTQATENLTTEMVRIAHINGSTFKYIPDELGLDLASVTPTTIGNIPVIILHNTKLNGWGLVCKGIFDRIAGVFLLILISPIFIITAIIIKLKEPKAPIFYASKRVGKNGKTFPCFKFRTMVQNADKIKKDLMDKNERGDIFFKIKNDPRITKIGTFLRKTSIDELPQFINVIKGDMSLIGPRPHLLNEVKQYQRNDLRILSIKPGITGFSQINGRSDLNFKQEIQYELFYIKNWSVWLDIMIFFKSIWVVIMRKGAS